MKTIQIRNAQKIFRKYYFKMCGHDFVKVWQDIYLNLNNKERLALTKLDSNLREKYGDYEVYVEVLPGKIKVTPLEEFD